MNNRVIKLDGARNFRDMGGYAGTENRRVKWGMLYRSDHLANLTNDDICTLERLNIRTILDFRSPFEIEGAPDAYKAPHVYVINPDNYTAEVAAQAGLGASLDEENLRLVEEAKDISPQTLQENHPVLEMYRQLVELPEAQKAYARMLEILADPTTPASVQHCRGGKDRTGYGAALILYLLGVGKEDIVADYMLTGKLRQARNEFKMGQYRELTADPFILDYLYSLIDTRPEFILESFRHMEHLSGSVDHYMREHLGVTPALRDILCEMYLEDA